MPHLHDTSVEEPLALEPVLPSLLILGPAQWDIITDLSEHNATEAPLLSCPADKVYPPHRKQILHLMHNFPAASNPGLDSSTQSLTANSFGGPRCRQT